MEMVPVCLADHVARARARLDPATTAWLESGAADGLTLAANRAAWDVLTLWPRVLQPLDGLNTRIRLLGREWPTPLLLAPLAHQAVLHPQAELASALAACAQSTGVVLSTLSNTPMETVAEAIRGDAQRGPLWFQLSWLDDRAAALALALRAQAAGYEALVLTIDAPVNGARDRARQAGFRLPPGVHAVHLPQATAPDTVAGLAARAPTWDDVAWLQERVSLPLLLKGVLRPDDARLGVSLGAQGLIVSNHGGRTLDGLPATARALPAIAQAVAGQAAVLVDGGIRRGTDVLKARALGADAVLLGRAFAWGLASAGAQGVAHVLRVLRDELEAAMALSGVTALDQLPADLVAPVAS